MRLGVARVLGLSFRIRDVGPSAAPTWRRTRAHVRPLSDPSPPALSARAGGNVFPPDQR
jgi:hypothetical protein